MTEEKCTCKGKEICSKMQNASVKEAIKSIKAEQHNPYAVAAIVTQLRVMLKTYKCLPVDCLMTRLDYFASQLPRMTGTTVINAVISMLIVELETWQDSCQQ